MALSPRFCRLYSSTPTSTSSPAIPSAVATAFQFLSKTQSLPPQTQTQVLDGNQLQRLSATLSRPELAAETPREGTPIPACWHLAYFTPSQIEEALGRDGTDTTFNPPRPYTRRMWAGGELEWIQDHGKGLRVGQVVREVTRLISAEGKRTRGGEEMVIVGVDKRFEYEGGVALVDKRNWIFRPEITTPQTPASKPPVVSLPEGAHTRDFIQTPVTLFRFSALTFNAHKIHYNREWCREVEGHRDLVVHGPLNLINMVNLWRDAKGGDSGLTPRKITYRATSPLYAGERYRIVLDEETQKVSGVRIVDSYGKTSMVGKIESF